MWPMVALGAAGALDRADTLGAPMELAVSVSMKTETATGHSRASIASRGMPLSSTSFRTQATGPLNPNSGECQQNWRKVEKWSG